MSEKTNAERFLDAYARIEHEMGKIVKEVKYIPFSQLLYQCAKTNWVIAKNQQALREYSELRNAIVHLRGSNTEIIAEPSDSVTKDIERIADLLTLKDSVMDYASTPVTTVSIEEHVSEAYDLMLKMETSKLPVYRNGVYQGIITLDDVCYWAMKQKDTDGKVRSAMKNNEEKVRFLARNESVLEAMRVFDKAYRAGKRITAILITEHGLKEEKPIGIITMQDLVEMMQVVL